MSGKRLTPEQKTKTFALLARGVSIPEILRILKEEDGVAYTKTSLVRLKKSNAATIDNLKNIVQANAVKDVDTRIRGKVLDMIESKVDRALSDGTKLEALDKQWREGEITDLKEYRRKRKGLIDMSIQELLKISREMQPQDKPPAPADPVFETGASVGAKERILKAIQDGDTITLQQIIIENSNANPA